MGQILAKLRRKKTNTEVIEKLDKEIRSIEDYGRNTEQAHKRIVGRFLLFSIGVYLLTAFLFFFYFYPSSFKQRLLYIVPLCLAPVIILSTKRLLTWYYNRKITKNQKKLVNLHDEKKKLLDLIMETETYKVARGILEKYAPEQIRKTTIPVTSRELTPLVIQNTPDPRTGVRNRFPMTGQQPRTSFGPTQQTPHRGAPTPLNQTVGMSMQLATPANAMVPATNNQVVPHSGVPTFPGMPLPRAILPKERSIFDKMVEYLVGDGPSNRFALICKQCSGHNGMALKEDFEYISYRCCYCRTFNPARKQRPAAPKLEFGGIASPPRLSDTSESDKNSGSDSDHENIAEVKKSMVVETLYSKEQSRMSDNEPTSDFDKLSDSELKLSDSEETTVKIKDTDTVSKVDSRFLDDDDDSQAKCTLSKTRLI